MGRTPCCDKSGLKKGPWTQEEDLMLINYINTHGPGNWRNLPKNAGTNCYMNLIKFFFSNVLYLLLMNLFCLNTITGLQRCGKSCRLRWTNYLRPDIKRGRFSFEEEESIIQLHSVLGNKYVCSSNFNWNESVLNFFNCKKICRFGFSSVTA